MDRRPAYLHEVLGVISLLVGLSFMLETYTLRSLSMLAPMMLMDGAVPLVAQVTGKTFTPLQIWGACFFLGGTLILVPSNPLFRFIFLVGGCVSWVVWALASLYASLVGPAHETAGSLVGVVFGGIVFGHFVAVRRVRQDFERERARRYRRRSSQSGRVQG